MRIKTTTLLIIAMLMLAFGFVAVPAHAVPALPVRTIEHKNPEPDTTLETEPVRPIGHDAPAPGLVPKEEPIIGVPAEGPVHVYVDESGTYNCFVDCADEAVMRAVTLGLIAESDGTEAFRPDDPLTHASFAEMCLRAFGESAKEVAGDLGEVDDDVAVSYEDAIEILYRIWAAADGGDLSSDLEDALEWAAERDDDANWQGFWTDGSISRRDACRFFIEICELS